MGRTLFINPESYRRDPSISMLSRAEECTLRCLQLKLRRPPKSTNLGLAWLVALVEPKWLRSDTHRWGAAVWRTTALWNMYIYICMYIHKHFASRNCRAADLDQPTKPTAASSNRGVAGQVLRNMCVPSRMPQKCSAKPRGQTILTAP